MTGEKALPPKPLPRVSLAGKIGLGIVAFVLLFGMVGYFVLPGVLISQAETQVAETLHRRLTIEKIDVNPYTLSFTVHGLKLMEPDGNTVFAAFDELEVDVSLQSLFRLAPVVRHVRLEKPYVHVILLQPHHYNFDDLVQATLSQPASPQAAPARFAIYNIQVDAGEIVFDDRPRAVVHHVANLTLGVPFLSSLPSQVDIFVEPLLRATVDGASVLVKGRAKPFAPQQDATVNIDLDGMDLPRYAEYLPFNPRFKLADGKLDLHLAADFHRTAAEAPFLAIRGNVLLQSLVVDQGDGTPVIRLPELAVALRDIDVFSRKIHITKIALTQPELHLSRNGKGTLNILRMATLPPAKAANPEKAARAEAAPPQPGPSRRAAGPHLLLDEFSIQGARVYYRDAQGSLARKAILDGFDLTAHNTTVDFRAKAVTIAALALSGKSVRLEDRTLRRPVVTTIAAIALSLRDFSTEPDKDGHLEFSADVNRAGRIGLKGTVGMNPLHGALAVDVRRIDVLPAQPYFTRRIGLFVLRGQLSAHGALQWKVAADGALKGGYQGSLSLGDVATVDKVHAQDFLRWKSLFIGGIDARFNPVFLSIGEIALNDFFARVIVDPDGRINLQDIVSGEKRTAATNAVHAPGQAVPAPTIPRSAAARKVAPIRIGKVTLQDGEVKFSDNHIQPHYSADLANLGGIVSGLSSDASTAASVDLRGEVNAAPLEIAGKINPLTGNLYLDMKADVRGMELPPFTPYSGKYVGYGIRKGKLSFEVRYHVADGKLDSENHLTLDQLTFGGKVESASATHLPVLLAVALLRDRNGVIDIDLPISGSLNDPDFSVGGIILRVVVNFITKAVTSPFALIGSIFGGGESLSWMDFDPGRYAINAAGLEKLKSLAKALNERPGLKLEIIGRADRDADAEGMRRALIEEKVRAIKIKRLVDQGRSRSLEDVKITPQEYPALLRRVYEKEKFPKPRGLFGFEKSLPVPEMEKLMMANTQISDGDLAALANERAQAVQDWLIRYGKVPAARIFIVRGRPGEGRSGKEQASASRVDFSLK